MHPSLRLLTARLPPFVPTGLAGILTHPNPRPTLIALYNHTLTLLSGLPAHSVYRQSVENLTRHRLGLVEAVKPEGYEAYKQELEAAKEQNGIKGKGSTALELDIVVTQARMLLSSFADENTAIDKTIRGYQAAENNRWQFPHTPSSTHASGTVGEPLSTEIGSRAALPPHGENFGPAPGVERVSEVPFLPIEPSLSAEQITELEEKVGGGLIEEVIDQGWAELRLVGSMEESRVWEPLEIVPEEGQWVGFERKP